MFVIATFVCGGRCETRVNTVVVKAGRRGVDEVVRKLSVHSCYYQSWPSRYADLIVVGGDLIRCELTPECEGEGLKVLSLSEFRQLWQKRHRLHREVQEELARGAKTGQTRTRQGRRAPHGMPAPPRKANARRRGAA
jgi:hypothetical protein